MINAQWNAIVPPFPYAAQIIPQNPSKPKKKNKENPSNSWKT